MICYNYQLKWYQKQGIISDLCDNTMSQSGGAVAGIKVIRRTDSNVKPTPSSNTSDNDKSCSVGCFSVNGRHSQVKLKYFSQDR